MNTIEIVSSEKNYIYADNIVSVNPEKVYDFEKALLDNSIETIKDPKMNFSKFNFSSTDCKKDCFSDYLKKTHEKDGHRIVVFINKHVGEIIGYFSFSNTNLIINGEKIRDNEFKICELMMFAVDKKYHGLHLFGKQKKTFGMFMMEYALSYITLCNYPKTLVCVHAVPKATTFYERNGFIAAGFVFSDADLKSKFMYICTSSH